VIPDGEKTIHKSNCLEEQQMDEVQSEEAIENTRICLSGYEIEQVNIKSDEPRVLRGRV
jgi:hypothetical protein